VVAAAVAAEVPALIALTSERVSRNEMGNRSRRVWAQEETLALTDLRYVAEAPDRQMTG
jgi:hypothetical protein